MEGIVEGIFSDSKLKILICHNFYQSRGGEEETVFREKLLLEKKGHDVILFTKDNKEIAEYRFRKKLGLLFKTFFSWKTYKEIRHIIEKNRPDIAHIHNVFPLISPSLYYVLKKHGVPIVQTLHNYRLICPNGLFLDNKNKICEKCVGGNFFHAIAKKCYRRSRLQTSILSLSLRLHRWLKTFGKIDVYISPSRFLKSKMVEAGFPDEKIEVKPHFVDTEELAPSGSYDDYSVFMGRIAKEKGIALLSDTFKNFPELKLKIIGSGPRYRVLKDFVAKNHMANIELLGFIGNEKRFQILKRAMFLIFPSNWYENFPYVLIESLSLGIPVIASRIGGIPEVIEEGKTGLLFQPGNLEELREKISVLAGNRKLLASMRSEARRTALQKYSEEKGYEALWEIYSRCARP